MANLPSWLAYDGFNIGTNEMIVHVRLWHPGFWFSSLKAVALKLCNIFVRRCGFECSWVHPYGFVPECGCPIHDKDDS